MALLREVTALVPMPRLLEALGIPVNERTRRCRCILHGGTNPSAFSWCEDGIWHCHACGAGGDRIALVRAVRKCSFYKAMEFLSEIAGVTYLPQRASAREFERMARHRELVETAAWKIRDELLRLRRYYRDALHRSDRLWFRFGKELIHSDDEVERELVWAEMKRLAPAATFFLAAYNFLCDADVSRLTHFALATPAQRRALILGDTNANDEFQAP
jgi:hypothetical protein